MEQAKGLEVARQFFFDWGLPFLQQHFPGCVDRIAAGRLLGSDVLGADDTVSRDHNWGPQFFLFLTDTDYQHSGAEIADTMNAVAPNPWNGYRLVRPEDQQVIVVSTPTFFEKMLDLNQRPEMPRDWLPVLTRYESELYFIRHGAVFQDPLGELSKWRAALHEYPGHIQRSRLAEECDRIWHRGEYNFVQRMAQRDDPLRNFICLGEFVDAVMRLFLLASGDFTPYWKWLPQEFRKLPDAPRVEPLLERLVLAHDRAEQRQLVQDICALVHQHLLTLGLVTGEGANLEHLPLLNDRNELRRHSKRLQ